MSSSELNFELSNISASCSHRPCYSIRRQDPLAKVVIFSAWTESLQILMQAFFRNSIEYVRLEQAGANKREGVVRDFVENPSIAAFFLHTKSQSAGLNLTCAQYVSHACPSCTVSVE